MKTKQPFHRVVLSVLAAAMGIQARTKADEDFHESSPWAFIFIGIVFLLMLVGGLMFVVSRVISAS